jgi:hypothetical protein
VNFQEVVHSALTEDAEVVEASVIQETEWTFMRCASDAKKSRGNGTRCCGRRPEQGRHGAPVQHHGEDCGQVDRPVPKAGVSPATVSRVLRRLGVNKLAALESSAPVRHLRT